MATKTVTPFDAYKKYVALKLHFNSEKYDYFRMKGVVRANISTFQARNDHYKFQKLARVHTPESLEKLLVANFVKNKDLWVGDVLSPEARDNLAQRTKIEESLAYIFQQDAEFIFQKKKEHESLFTVKGRPGLVKYTMQEAIALESYIILCDILNLTGKFNKDTHSDPAWEEFSLRSRKYAPFVKYDKEKFTQILKTAYKNVMGEVEQHR